LVENKVLLELTISVANFAKSIEGEGILGDLNSYWIN